MERLFDSELKVMEIIWEREPVSAKEVSLIAAETIGWNKNTTYTIIKKLENKGVIRRTDPGFVCTALLSRKEVRRQETRTLLERVFHGSKAALFSALLEDENLSDQDIQELRKMIETR